MIIPIAKTNNNGIKQSILLVGDELPSLRLKSGTVGTGVFGQCEFVLW